RRAITPQLEAGYPRQGVMPRRLPKKATPEFDQDVAVILHCTSKGNIGNQLEGFFLIAPKSHQLPKYAILSKEYTDRTSKHENFEANPIGPDDLGAEIWWK
ncbi:hypothetical protein DIT71_03270, partial [Marinobacter vulgaris]